MNLILLLCLFSFLFIMFVTIWDLKPRKSRNERLNDSWSSENNLLDQST